MEQMSACTAVPEVKFLYVAGSSIWYNQYFVKVHIDLIGISPNINS